MIEVARALDPFARDVRKTFDEQGEIQQQAYAQISKARFALEGTSSYPTRPSRCGCRTARSRVTRKMVNTFRHTRTSVVCIAAPRTPGQAAFRSASKMGGQQIPAETRHTL